MPIKERKPTSKRAKRGKVTIKLTRDQLKKILGGRSKKIAEISEVNIEWKKS